MRLLTYGTDGALELTADLIGADKIPPYAILSHTWHEGQEVTFDDMRRNLGKNKTGYDKILFCARQAKLDNLDYFWVDTCCIDKSSSAELTEAINSMFKWYSKANKCYVFLSDVSITGSASSDVDFQKSRWFTRGWTLQELLAPASVQFFTRDRMPLGDKVSLGSEIAKTTGIPSQALYHSSVSDFDVHERISWAKHRQTRREEDEAYSLLGLLDVQMPLIYGEGRRSAFRRLHREIRDSQAEIIGVESSGNVHWIVPQTVNTLFTGRSELLDRIQRALRNDNGIDKTEAKRLVITGLGGQGKSEVCVKVASLMREYYWGIFWVDVSNRFTAQNGFTVVARSLGCSVQTIEESLQALANSRRQWLLILDNADDATFDYSTYLPSGNRGAVIMTSRVPSCRKYSTLEPEALEGLELEYSTQLLLKAARLPEASWSSHTTQAQEVVCLLGSHTLALIQAGAYIAEGYCRLGQYGEKFQRQRRQLLEHHPDQEKSRYQNVYATFEASLEGLKHSRDEAAQDALDLLAAFSMLHSSPLPLMVFRDAWAGARMVQDREECLADTVPKKHALTRNWRFKLLGRSSKPIHSPKTQMAHAIDDLGKEHVSRLPGLIGTQLMEWNDYRLKKASAILASLSLVTRHHFEEDDGISMHPLAHAWARDRLGPMQQKQTWVSTACLFALARAKSTIWQVHEQKLLPHIQSFFSLDHEVVLSYGPQRMMLPLLLHCGWVIIAVRDYKRLQSLLEVIYRELGITPWNIPEKHFSLCMLASRAALHLRDTRLAIVLLEHINQVQKSTSKEMDPAWLMTQHDLARAYNDNGDVQKAMAMLEHLVKTYKMMPLEGESLAWLASTQYELARAYNLNGQTEEAVALLQEVVDRHQPASQKDADHDRLRSQHALAVAYTANGQSNDAIALLEQVVNAYETFLDDAHPDRLLSQQELARAYDTNGQTEKSLPLLEHVVKVKENTLQDTDYSLLSSQYALAYTYSCLGQTKEALKLREHIVNMYKTILEETQPDRLAAEYALALTYIDTKQPQKALVLMRHVVEIRKTMLKSEHPQRRESERLLRGLEAGQCV